jgi:glucose/mannose-6-phosphate isomerase
MQDIINEKIKKFDSKNVLGSVELFAKQCRMAWEAGSENKNNGEVKNILVCGMGGSALGAYILQSLNIFSVPISMSHDYTIPEWVSGGTLVLAMSYSGGTEETLSATQKAIEAGAEVVVITVGGELKNIAEKNNLEIHTIDKSANPCGQPRFGVGSMMMEILKVCIEKNVCSLKKENVESALAELENYKIDFEKVWADAEKLKDRMPVLVHAEHLTNLGRFTRNQIHETAKALALAHEIPELNHHLMEGLTFPTTNKEKLYFIFFESNLYSAKIVKRIAVTKDVLDKQGIQYMSVQMEGQAPLSQALIGMLRAMYLAYSLALIHEKDPSDIPWVNYFKEQLVK